MFYYTYKITNKITNKIYIGVHKTESLDDGYMGSGKAIKLAIEKYELINFQKEILEFFENAELMYVKEKEIVNDEFLLREDTYNLRRGGTGGFDHINKTVSKEVKRKAGSLGGIIGGSISGIKNIQTARLKVKNQLRSIWVNDGIDNLRIYENECIPNGWLRGQIQNHCSKYWINNGIISKKLNINECLPEGWNKGRLL